MVETDTSNANDQLAAAHQELRALALQLQEFLNWQGLPDWAPGGIAESRALESEANLSQIDKLLSRRIGIVGLEGAGKSTLINAMFGQSVVPTDADQPGTAIPIFVHATSNTSTAHAIETEEGAIRPCADYDELTSYVLQRHNADNHKQVRHASISLHAPHLPSGLCVVDLPGTAGMSSTLRKSSLASVESVDRVILVVQDRNAGPALELAHDVLSRGIEICAVAINLQMSKLVDPADLQPIPDDEARNHIAATRNHIERSFLNEFPRLQEKCKFFAFHFPSMHSLAISSSANHWLPSHVEEIFRFADWFIVSVSKRAALARLQQATQDFASKLTQLKNRVLTRRKQIDGLLHSDPCMQEQVCQKLAEYEKELRKEWARSDSDSPIRKAQLKAWDDFEPSARLLKADLQELQQTTKEALPDNWWLQNWQLKSEISESINRSLSGSSDRLNKDAMRVVQGFCDTVQKIALEALAAKFSRLPIDLGPLPMMSHRNVSIWEPPLIDPERQSLAEYDSAKAIERFWMSSLLRR